MSDSQQKITLACTPRTITGKANRTIRKTGLIPAVVYGESTPSLSVSVTEKDFASVFARAGETSVVYCQIDGAEVPTLIADVSMHPVRDTVQHVDFRRVNLAKKITAQVPVELTGDSPAVKSGGVLLQQVYEVEVEALPQDIPHEITIDVSTLTAVDQEITIAQIPVSTTYAILEDAERVVISVVAHKEESTESQLERSETEITSAKPDAEGDAATDAKAPAAEDKK